MASSDEYNPATKWAGEDGAAALAYSAKDADEYEREGEEWFGVSTLALLREAAAAAGLADAKYSVLDVGCGGGAGLALWARAGAGSLRGIELNATAADACRRQVPGADVATGDVVDAPAPLHRADIVFCSAVLQHIRPEDRAAFFAALRRQGRFLVVVVPMVPSERVARSEGGTSTWRRSPRCSTGSSAPRACFTH